jgi:hypothetical protein
MKVGHPGIPKWPSKWEKRIEMVIFPPLFEPCNFPVILSPQQFSGWILRHTEPG